MKKEKWNKGICWEMSHCGLRVRVDAMQGTPKISLEVFDDANAPDQLFSHLFKSGDFPVETQTEERKGRIFIEHIDRHLKQMKIKGKVICKICGKDVDTIYKEEGEG